MTKPTAYSGKSYPFTELTDREFEELVYTLFNTEIEAGIYKGKFDKVDLLPGVAERGRDCKLYYNGKVAGNIQCKNLDDNITTQEVACELIKFALNCIVDPLIIPDNKKFTYFFVAAKGFSTNAIDLIGEIKNRFEKERQLNKWILITIGKSAEFKKLGFTVDSVKDKVLDTIKAIDIKPIFPIDLNRMMQPYASTIGEQFFEVRRVIDIKTFREIIAQKSSDNKHESDLLLSDLVDDAIQHIRKLVNNTKNQFNTHSNDVKDIILYNIDTISHWCNEMSFLDLHEAKQVEKSFVELDMYLMPRRTRIVQENIEKLPLNLIFQNKYRSIVLLGQPGAGKTTSMKYLCHKVLGDPSFHPNDFSFPLVIRLRELNIKAPQKIRGEDDAVKSLIFKHLFDLFNLSISFSENLLGSEHIALRTELIEMVAMRFINELKILLILDGFDELVKSDYKEMAIQEIRKIAEKINKGAMIVTSRTGDFSYHIENTKQFEICPLDKKQISIFAHKWLGNKRQAIKFLKEIANSPFSDTTIKPLTIAHLCAIFERVGKIPDKPKTVYRKIINLLLEEWDEQRSVKRVSKYANFEIDRKFEFLCNLAYELSVTHQSDIFSKDQLDSVYLNICANFDLNKSEVRSVVDELESHTGLFVVAGYHEYEFAHKSLQEFLTAEYIVKLPYIPQPREVLLKIPNELAIATTISSNPSGYLVELSLNVIYDKNLPKQFYERFIDRLIQEKPDFNTYSEIVIIALFVIYSLYIDETLLRGGQKTLFYEDNLLEQYERFFNIVCKRNSKEAIYKYYKDVRLTQSIDNLELHILEKIRDIPGYHLPDSLYARSSFIPQLSS